MWKESVVFITFRIFIWKYETCSECVNVCDTTKDIVLCLPKVRALEAGTKQINEKNLARHPCTNDKQKAWWSERSSANKTSPRRKYAATYFKMASKDVERLNYSHTEYILFVMPTRLNYRPAARCHGIPYARGKQQGGKGAGGLQKVSLCSPSPFHEWCFFTDTKDPVQPRLCVCTLSPRAAHRTLCIFTSVKRVFLFKVLYVKQQNIKMPKTLSKTEQE